MAQVTPKHIWLTIDCACMTEPFRDYQVMAVSAAKLAQSGYKHIGFRVNTPVWKKHQTTCLACELDTKRRLSARAARIDLATL